MAPAASAAQDVLLWSLQPSRVCRGQPESRRSRFAHNEGRHHLHEISCGYSWVWVTQFSCRLSPPQRTAQLQSTPMSPGFRPQGLRTALNTTPGIDQGGHRTTPCLKWQQFGCVQFHARKMFCGISYDMRTSLGTQEKTILRSQMCSLATVLSTTQARVISEERTLTENMPQPVWPVGKTLVHFLNWLLMREQPSVGSATPGLLSLNSIRRQPWGTNLQGLCISSCFQVLSLRSCPDLLDHGVEAVRWNKPFAPQNDFDRGVLSQQ